MNKWIIVLLSLLLIMACSNKENDKTKASQNHIQKDQTHILKQQKNALDKARGVEKLLQNGADNQQQFISEQVK